jgi:hypothetical protein
MPKSSWPAFRIDAGGFAILAVSASVQGQAQSSFLATIKASHPSQV